MKSLLFGYPSVALVEAINFKPWPKKIRQTESRRSKREAWSYLFSPFLSHDFQTKICSFINLIHNLSTLPTSRHMSTTYPSPFLPRNNLFRPDSSPIYFKMNFTLLISQFKDFLQKSCFLVLLDTHCIEKSEISYCLRIQRNSSR